MFSLYIISMAIGKGVESMLEKEKVDFIKIEGKVSSEARKTLVDRFQHNSKCLLYTGSFRKNVKSKMFVKISIFTKNQFSQLF